MTLKPKGLGDKLNTEVIRAQTKLPQNTCPLAECTRLFCAAPPTQWLLRSCWLPPYSTGFHSITVYGCAPPSSGTKLCDAHYSLEKLTGSVKIFWEMIGTNTAASLFSTAGPNCQESNYFNELPRYDSTPVTGLSWALLVYSYERTLWWSDFGKYWVQWSYLYLLQELLSLWGLWEIPERWKHWVSYVALCYQEKETILSYCPRCCDEIPWSKQLKVERAYSDSQLEVQSIMTGTLRQLITVHP